MRAAEQFVHFVCSGGRWGILGTSMVGSHVISVVAVAPLLLIFGSGHHEHCNRRAALRPRRATFAILASSVLEGAVVDAARSELVRLVKQHVGIQE